MMPREMRQARLARRKADREARRDQSTQGQRYVDANVPESTAHPSTVAAQRAHDIVHSQGGTHSGTPWDEAKHPRVPAGAHEGGQFSSGSAVTIHAPGHPNHGKTGTVVSVGNDSERTHQIKLSRQKSTSVNAYVYHPARDLLARKSAGGIGQNIGHGVTRTVEGDTTHYNGPGGHTSVQRDLSQFGVRHHVTLHLEGGRTSSLGSFMTNAEEAHLTAAHRATDWYPGKELPKFKKLTKK